MLNHMVFIISFPPPSSFYKQLFNCQLLNRLSMPDNDLAVLPAAIANLINLRELDVSKNSKQDDSFVEPFCFKAWKLSFEISNIETVFLLSWRQENIWTH